MYGYSELLILVIEPKKSAETSPYIEIRLETFPFRCYDIGLQWRLFMPYLEYDDQGTVRRINLAGDRETFIGRDRQCTICLDGVPQVSRRHCVVYFNTNLNAYAVADMHSTNGTRLNGSRLAQRDMTLKDGDRIQVGAVVFTFRGETEQPDVKLVDPLNMDPLSYTPVIPSLAPGMQKNYTNDLIPGTPIGGMVVAAVLSACDESVHYLLTEHDSERRKTMKIFKTPQTDPMVRRDFTRVIGGFLRNPLPKTLLPYTDCGIRGGEYCFYTTDFQECPSLATIISARAPIEEKKALALVYSIVEALDDANQQNIFHGNLKPSKILYSQKGSFLIGYGLADWLRKHTKSNFLQRPEWYASPEFSAGEELSWKSDMYSLGIVFYQILTGVLPYRADTEQELVRMHAEEPLPFIKDRNENVEVTSVTEGIIRRMTMKRPMNRYSSWNEVLFQLKKANSLLEEKEKQSLL